MLRNVGSQFVAFQLNAKADGTAVTTGTATVYLVGDNSAQGTLTNSPVHKGNGCWTVVPLQGETNYKQVAYTIVHSSGIIETRQFDMGANVKQINDKTVNGDGISTPFTMS